MRNDFHKFVLLMKIKLYWLLISTFFSRFVHFVQDLMIVCIWKLLFGHEEKNVSLFLMYILVLAQYEPWPVAWVLKFELDHLFLGKLFV